MLRFCDSFNHDVAGGIPGEYVSGSFQREVGTGRWGNDCFQAPSGSSRNLLWAGTAQATWIVGFAWLGTVALSGSTTDFLVFLDGATTHVTLRMQASTGHLQVTRNGTVLGTGTATLTNNVWYYIETKVTINDTTGVAEVRVNGVADITLSSQDTRNAGNSTADRIQIVGPTGGSQTYKFGDYYICDSVDSGVAGIPNNDFLGDVRVEALFANGNGTTSGLNGSDGNATDNYLLVDETTPNGDTDYVEGSIVGDKDTYAFTNPTPSSGTVYGVQTLAYAKKTDAGTRSIRNLARLSGTEIDNGAHIPLSSTYQYYSSIFEAKPGGGAWSLTDVANAEFGPKVAA